MIKLYNPPCVTVDALDYTDTNGENQTLVQDTDFLLSSTWEPARIFPMPGQMWPACLYVPEAVRIHFTAGYSADGSLVPARAKMAILQLVASWYENREAAMAGGLKEIPQHVAMLLWSMRIMDMQPSRG